MNLRHARRAAIATSLLLAAASGFAQPSAPSKTSAGNEGARLASQGAGGVAPCSSCHGAGGQGQAAAGFPRLAGQPADYLAWQLESYANDSRRNPVMQPIAKAMTPAQRSAAAKYYATLGGGTASARPPSSAASAATSLGRLLATVGDERAGVQACANCHGPQGVGEGPTPYLSGQHASYLRAALGEWKDGSRNNDPSGQMQRIAKSLSPAQVDAVVAYFAGLPLPLPTASRPTSNTAALKRPGRTLVSGPQAGAGAGAGATQGVGTEQGSPLSGGTQGVGSAGNPTGPQSGAPGAASSPGR